MRVLPAVVLLLLAASEAAGAEGVWRTVLALLRRRASPIPLCAQAQAEKFEHVGLGSGLADSRGQHRNATSKFGLRFS